MIRFRVKAKGAEELLNKFPDLAKDVGRLERAAVNITVKGVKLDASRLIRDKIAITKNKSSSKTPKQVIESRIKLKFVKDESGNGELRVTDSQIPIKWFSPKQTPKIRKPLKKGRTAKKKPFRFKMIRSKDMIKAARKTGLKLVKSAKTLNPFKKKKKKTVKGTTAKIRKGGSRVLYPHGFGPNYAKLGFTIWERTGKSRYPIESPYGVDVAAIVRQSGGERRLKASGKIRLEKEIKRRVARLKYIKPRRGKAKT